MKIDNPPSSPFVKGGIATPPFSKGRLGGISLLTNIKGISVIFLIIAMLLMVIIGYVFSYLIPSKQKSVVFPIQSTQAFFIAQSGVEFAVRYATDNGWTTTTLLTTNLNGVWRNLGSGQFILTYNYSLYGDKLISVGQVPTGTTRRSVQVSNFTTFLGGENLILDPNFTPCYANGVVNFHIISSSGVTLQAFQAYWTGQPGSRTISYIIIGGATAWGPGYYNATAYPPTSPTSFTSNQTIPANTSTLVQVQFNGNFVHGPYNVQVVFYSAKGVYNFILNGSSMLPGC